MKSLTIKNYNLSADIIRILATFFVIYSHSTDRFVLYTTLKASAAWHVIYYFNTLSRVAVPIFVVLSGYLLLNNQKTKNVKAFYQRRFSRILYPFIIWLTIYYLWAIYWDQTKITINFIFQTLWYANIWHLYFLIIILELYLLTPLLVRFNKTRFQQTILFWSFLALSVLCSLLTIFHINVQTLSLTIFIPYIGYYYAGGYLHNVKITKLWRVIFLILYLILAYITNRIADGYTTTYIIFNFSPTLLPMTLFLFLALKDFHKEIGIPLTGKFGKVIAYSGRLTFGIYLLHFLVLDLVLKYFNLLPWQLHAPLILWACAPSIITFTITYAAIALLRMLPYSTYFVG